MTGQRAATRLPTWLALLLVAMAGLLLEVGYTRIASYKLWYYYTYLVIGLSLLGIGSGGIVVAIWKPIRRVATERIIALASVWGAISVAVGYVVIARIPIDTISIWDYGTWDSFRNLALLAVICFVLFSAFVALGTIVAVVLGRARERVGRLYFADLTGAALGCFLAIPLMARLSPPAVVMLSAFTFAVVGLLSLPRRSPLFAAGAVVSVLLVVGVVAHDRLPEVRAEETKVALGSGIVYSEWGPVFRVDVAEIPDPGVKLLFHDATLGSGLWEFHGDVGSLDRIEQDPRKIPFDVLDGPPDRELIIGSAGGNEILASLRYRAPRIEAVELNPVTVGLLTDEFADFTGHLPERDDVDLHRGDGRTYLARSDATYDLVWYVAPDSYAANNAASSGAFVLSESYLYTTEMISETLEHLTDGGIMVVQFGELRFESRPNRTSRYVVTAREALEEAGIEDPSRHILVAAHTSGAGGDLSTIIVKRTPFTPEESAAFLDSVDSLPDDVSVYAPGADPADLDLGDHVVARLARGTADDVDEIVAGYDREISAITDDAPFFWHFSAFDDVLADIATPLNVSDPEEVIGERVLLLLLLVAVIFAAVFLLLPFVAVRRTWAALPAKGTSGIYFAALGLGFMLFEITMIQRLVLFLGYPTYSLTVTLASILVSTGIGALGSRRLVHRSRTAMPVILAILLGLTLFYQFGLGGLTDSLLSAALGVRVLVTVAVLAPLGLCLGTFMPLGLGLVSRLGPHGEEYAAWSWAVNGFFSVIGSVLTTILSMAFGFSLVQYGALVTYAVAVLAFARLRVTTGHLVDPVADGQLTDVDLGVPVDEPAPA